MTNTEEKSVKKTSKAFNVLPETKEQINKLCEELVKNGTAKDEGEVLTILLNAYQNPTQPTPVDNPETEKKLAAKTAELDLLNEKMNSQNELIESMTKLFNTSPEKLFAETMTFKQKFVEQSQKIDQLNATIANEQQANKNLQNSLESLQNEQNTPDPMVVPVHLKADFERKLMDLTVERVSKRKGRTVTISELLRTMFLRYTIEKQAKWFYKFEISDDEIEKITGKKCRVWYNYFNSEK